MPESDLALFKQAVRDNVDVPEKQLTEDWYVQFGVYLFVWWKTWAAYRLFTHFGGGVSCSVPKFGPQDKVLKRRPALAAKSVQ